MSLLHFTVVCTILFGIENYEKFLHFLSFNLLSQCCSFYTEEQHFKLKNKFCPKNAAKCCSAVQVLSASET